jgi:hypothetical protein
MALPEPGRDVAETQVVDREIAAMKEISPLLIENPRPMQNPPIFVTYISRS